MFHKIANKINRF